MVVIEIVTLVVAGNAELTVPTDLQKQIQVGRRSVALRRAFVELWTLHMKSHYAKMGGTYTISTTASANPLLSPIK